jgi:amino acid adenylation domain-containing protein
MWFIDRLEPGNSLYNRPAFIRLKGELKTAVLERCLNEIIRRHEILRTTFPDVNGQPLQVILPFQPLALAVRDISGLPEAEREAAARRQATDEAALAFDLRRGPPIRAGLLRLGAQEHILLLTMHHIVFDGWSEGVLFQELAVLYESFSAGQPAPLSELPIQYADFAVWQRQWFREEIFDSQLAYWKKQLAGAAVLELPTDHPRPSVQTFRGSKQFFSLSRALTGRLKALGRAQGTTLFMTLLAAFQTLLHRYAAQDDILVGAPVAGRNRTDVEGLIGFFINTVVLRTDFSGDPSFRELLGRVRKVALDAYAHQDLPFEKLVEALHPQRNSSRSPLFQVMFAFQNAPGTAPSFAGLTVTSLNVESETAIFDLSLLMVEDANSLKATLEYNTGLFDAATISRMRDHFQILLESIAANPEQRLSHLSMLTEAERQQLLVEWNDTKKDYPQDKCIHELFEAQVERSPDAAAVVFQSRELTYRELNRRANQLARYLRKLGVGPDVVVGVCMERSIDMVVGLLAILKAGGAYMPIDPDYPKDRAAFMLADAAAAILLSQQRLIERLPRQSVTAIPLDTEWEAIAHESGENPASGVTAGNLAYVIFTSGSTGMPKGAMNTHRGICNRLLWMQETYELTATDRVLQKTPFSFDVSVWEFFWPLLTGACLVVALPGGHRDSAYLVKLIAEQKITTLHFVPSMLQVFLGEEGLDTLRCLRRVICSGEALPFELQERFFSRLGAELHNLYGPTEASVDVSFWACKRESHRRSVPIGRPIANTEIHLLDSHLQPVPVGVPGELYIRGDGVARGYLNRPELTAEKFVPNPVGNDPGARLYKTGDLARRLPDGNIEFLGRTDDQVKIRGFRIELGEIETALGQHPAIRETVVLAREDAPGEKRLAAYIVAPQQSASSISDLRGFLAEKLPEHMVPSVFVFLDALPLTSNGKIDRRNLPAPDQSRPEQENPFVAPRTSVEELLARIWGEVLELEQVGIHDNFFTLGGHSLLLTQIVARIQRAFLVSLPLRILFDAPTVADQSAAIAAAQLEQEDAVEAARIMEELKRLSPEEVAALLEAERHASPRGDEQ